MNEIKHTTGPWKAEKVVMSKYNQDAYFEIKQDREDDESVGMFARDVCQTFMRDIEQEGRLLAEDAANARLIATAPDLLRESKAVISEFFEEYEHPDHHPSNSPTIQAIKRLQEVIRKATYVAEEIVEAAQEEENGR